MQNNEVRLALSPILIQMEQDVFKTSGAHSAEEIMGLVLARYFAWDGNAVLFAASEALIEANFHSEAAKVSALTSDNAEERFKHDNREKGGA